MGYKESIMKKKLNQDAFMLHHFWYGIILMVVGFILVFNYAMAGFSLGVLGFIIAMDDMWQHFRQHWDEEYHSPLHRFYITYVYNRFQFIRTVNTWLDNIFSRRS